MRSRVNRRRRWAFSLSAVGAALAMALGFAATAHAASYTSWTNRSDSGDDPGGWWASATVKRTDADRIASSASFFPSGERLQLRDPYDDGHYAYAEVKVYNKSGSLVDTDTFKTGGYKEYNLGTPDGSGNIPEGYKVRIRACVTGDWYCSAWVSGVA